MFVTSLDTRATPSLPVAVALISSIFSCFLLFVALLSGVKLASQVLPSRRFFEYTPFLVSLDGDHQLFDTVLVLIDTLSPALLARSIDKKLIIKT
jgi:hypothetical protein